MGETTGETTHLLRGEESQGRAIREFLKQTPIFVSYVKLPKEM